MRRPQPHITSILAESKAAMDEIDRQHLRPSQTPAHHAEPSAENEAAIEESDRRWPGRAQPRERQPPVPQATTAPAAHHMEIEDIDLEDLGAVPRSEGAPNTTEINLSRALHQELAEIDLDEFDLDPNADYPRR
jgi:hypothetical protein